MAALVVQRKSNVDGTVTLIPQEPEATAETLVANASFMTNLACICAFIESFFLTQEPGNKEGYKFLPAQSESLINVAISELRLDGSDDDDVIEDAFDVQRWFSEIFAKDLENLRKCPPGYAPAIQQFENARMAFLRDVHGTVMSERCNELFDATLAMELSHPGFSKTLTNCLKFCV